jgi:hypothetical protein
MSEEEVAAHLERVCKKFEANVEGELRSHPPNKLRLGAARRQQTFVDYAVVCGDLAWIRS